MASPGILLINAYGLKSKTYLSEKGFRKSAVIKHNGYTLYNTHHRLNAL